MIEVSHLRKQFGDLVAVDDISFRIAPGEIVGFLGPNGAGKSTTMKMLTGFLAPTSGTISILGHDVAQDPLAAQQQMGYLPEGAPCYEEMTPATFLTFIARIRGLGDGGKARIAEIVSTLSLQSVLHQRIETLSKGFKRRVGLAQAILADPAVLILDEPTDGLDPNQKHQVRQLISGLAKDKIVIISTHILEEVTAVCSRAMIVAGGRIVADKTPLALKAMSRYHEALVIEMGTPDAAAQVVAALDPTIDVERRESRLVLLAQDTTSAEARLAALLAALSSTSLTPHAMYQEQGQLDEVFREITGGAR